MNYTFNKIHFISSIHGVYQVIFIYLLPFLNFFVKKDTAMIGKTSLKHQSIKQTNEQTTKKNPHTKEKNVVDIA